MTLAGYPIWMFAPLVLAMVTAILFVRSMAELTRQLTLKGVEEPGILLAGEGRLHDLDVHSLVWRLRLLWAVDAACILVFAYLIYRAEAV